MKNQTPSMLIPALVAGGVFGLMSGIPLIHLGCCIWAIGAGLSATFLYSRRARSAEVPFATGNGAIVGLLSGGIFGLIGGATHSTILGFAGALDPDVLAGQLSQNPMIAPEDVETAIQFVQSSGQILFVFVFLFIWLVSGFVFGAVGGAIGGSIFKVEPQSTLNGTELQPPPVG